MTTNKHTNSIEDLREQLEEFALHLKPGTTKGKHRTAIFDTLELARLVQTLIDKQVIEAEKKGRELGLTLSLHILKDTFRKLWTYEILYGEIRDMDDRDVTKELEEYQKLEPTRKQFADWYESRTAELKKKAGE